jgi:hypothetical protein
LNTLGIAQRIVDGWAKDADPELKGGWSQVEVRLGKRGDKPMGIVIWPSWRLDIVSFIIPDVEPTHETLSDIETCDMTYESTDGSIITKTHTADRTHDFDNMQHATACSVVDAFLSGTWTPPWQCGYCRDRKQGVVKPKWW